VLTIVTCILSLLSLVKMTLQKLKELSVLIRVPGYNVQYILCRWVDAVKNTPSMLKTWQKRVWQKDGASPPDSIYPYSEMHGALDEVQKERLDRVMKAPIDQDALRKAGL
jgi:hypothetical protein